MNIQEKAEIWIEYFDKLLNTEEPRELIKKGNNENSEVEVELTIEDVKKSVRNLKSNKVPGTDGIHLELMKYGGNKLLNRMYELVRQIWEEERIPEEWKETIIVPIHKSGDRDSCENYGGIALGNAAYKILLNITLGKIKPYVEKVTGEYQNGFRDGRSVIDSMFALKIINKKLWEYNQRVQYLLIDFQKAYDSLHRDTLWECMKEFKIPTKSINMCKTCVQKTRLVRIEGTLSSFFENKTGLKQGEPLSPVLFNLALQKVIQSIKMVPSGINIGKEQLNVSAYADDIALIWKNEIEIRKRFVEMENIARKFRLQINQEKTKYVIVERKNSFKK